MPKTTVNMMMERGTTTHKTCQAHLTPIRELLSAAEYAALLQRLDVNGCAGA